MSHFKGNHFSNADLRVFQRSGIRYLLDFKRNYFLKACKIIAALLNIDYKIFSCQRLRELRRHPRSGCIQFIRHCNGLARIDLIIVCVQDHITVLGNPSVYITVISLEEVKSAKGNRVPKIDRKDRRIVRAYIKSCGAPVGVPPC